MFCCQYAGDHTHIVRKINTQDGTPPIFPCPSLSQPGGGGGNRPKKKGGVAPRRDTSIDSLLGVCTFTVVEKISFEVRRRRRVVLRDMRYLDTGHRIPDTRYLLSVVPQGIPGYLRVPRGTSGYPRVPQGTSGYLRVPQGTSGYLRVPQGPAGKFIRGTLLRYCALRG